MKTIYSFLLLYAYSIYISAQAPAVYSNLKQENGQWVYVENGERYNWIKPFTNYSYSVHSGQWSTNGDVLEVNFLPEQNTQVGRGDKSKRPEFMQNISTENFNGTMYFGFIPYSDMKHAQPVYFKKSAKIESSKAEIKVVEQLSNEYDMVNWKKNGYGVIGYRVLNNKGEMIYDGKVGFTYTNNQLAIAPAILEGPFICNVSATSVTLRFTTTLVCGPTIKFGGRHIESNGILHEVVIEKLSPATSYPYQIKIGNMQYNFECKTAPENGARKAFSFAYCSDSRSGNGGGERDLYGANFYIMKKIAALAKQQNAAFVQFTGDLISGYSSSQDETIIQYRNWKKAIEPYAAYMPWFIGMGNHEAIVHKFQQANGNKQIWIDQFPFEKNSAEAIFAQEFTNPNNGPISEDGSKYDPNPNEYDFPSYRENVFQYRYDNIAVIVLNSNYWYAPTLKDNPNSSGNLHGYIMDNQLTWLKITLENFEKDASIDHIFVTQHTPTFPNGGHVSDDMWYRGNNQYRPYIAGKPVEKGIIERRDEYLDLLVNKSSKVRAILTGDEHNYNKTLLKPEVNIYPEKWELPKLSRVRTIWQINNGAAGAPYYAQEQTPWTPYVSGFTTQNALVFFDVNGKKINMRVINPDTLEEVDSAVIYE
jgi:hypothetical protein